MSHIAKPSKHARMHNFVAAFFVAWFAMALTSEALLQLMK